MTPTITVDGWVVTVTGLQPGSLVGWNDGPGTLADSEGVATHDYYNAVPGMPGSQPSPGRRFVVCVSSDGTPFRTNVDVATNGPQSAT
jgi:hypothetical protein